jgi:hypothetical protein
MIEQILMRIAKRGPGLTRLQSSDTTIAPSAASDSSLSFPASRPHSSASRSLATQTHSLTAWELAKDAHYSSYREPSSTHQAPREVPAAYIGYSMMHALIGSVIWSERKNIHKNIVHIVASNGDVVAALYPSERTVAVRKHIPAGGLGILSLKELPSSARPFEADAASQFEQTTVHMLLWYYGQAMPEAVEEIPDALFQAKMLLRKLPLVAPNALNVRHLQLIHLFSGGSTHLQTLLDLLSPEAKQFICADLASLYLTGCLVSSDPNKAA